MIARTEIIRDEKSITYHTNSCPIYHYTLRAITELGEKIEYVGNMHESAVSSWMKRFEEMSNVKVTYER